MSARFSNNQLLKSNPTQQRPSTQVTQVQPHAATACYSSPTTHSPGHRTYSINPVPAAAQEVQAGDSQQMAAGSRKPTDRSRQTADGSRRAAAGMR